MRLTWVVVSHNVHGTLQRVYGPFDTFGADDGETIIVYFLANARTWRGETARRIKKELNALVE